MSGCPSIVLEAISEEKYAALLATAQTQGLALTGISGATSYQGMTFQWNYDSAAQRLLIECTHKPFYVPCGMIEDKIRGLVA